MASQPGDADAVGGRARHGPGHALEEVDTRRRVTGHWPGGGRSAVVEPKPYGDAGYERGEREPRRPDHDSSASIREVAAAPMSAAASLDMERSGMGNTLPDAGACVDSQFRGLC